MINGTDSTFMDSVPHMDYQTSNQAWMNIIVYINYRYNKICDKRPPHGYTESDLI